MSLSQSASSFTVNDHSLHSSLKKTKKTTQNAQDSVGILYAHVQANCGPTPVICLTMLCYVMLITLCTCLTVKINLSTLTEHCALHVLTLHPVYIDSQRQSEPWCY